MARRNRRAPQQGRPLSSGSLRRVEEQADGQWIVATRAARPDTQQYVCPVCGNQIASTTAHLVVWPADGGAEDRRHVHRACWQRRAGQRDPVRW